MEVGGGGGGWWERFCGIRSSERGKAETGCNSSLDLWTKSCQILRTGEKSQPN